MITESSFLHVLTRFPTNYFARFQNISNGQNPILDLPVLDSDGPMGIADFIESLP